MKKLISVFTSLLLLGSLVLCVFAAGGPEITLQPQSPNYPEYSVAIYTVKASGSNLHATWYMEWLGNTYTISNLSGAMQPWEPFAGEAYGPKQLDDHTFAFVFEGIEYDLDGAYIWCVIEDGHYDVTSQKTRISVGNPNSPPQIVDIPSQVTVEQGRAAEIRCVAKSPDGSQLSFLWYETDTGKMEDMRAANRGTETTDYMFLDTSMVGTRYYLCKVETSDGGLAYSSIVTVTVTEKAPKPTQPPETQPQPTEPSPTTAPTQKIPSGSKEDVRQTDPTPTQPSATEPSAAQPNTGLPWWSVIVIGLLGISVGINVALIVIRKSK